MTKKKTTKKAKPDAALEQELRRLTAENRKLKALLARHNIIWGG